MKSMRHWWIGLALLGLAGVTHAADEKKALRVLQDKVQRLQQQAQAAEQDRSRLETEKSETQAQLQKAQAESAQLRGAVQKAAALQKQLDTLNATQDGLTRRLAESEEKFKELQGRHEQELAKGRQLQAELKERQENLAQRLTALQTCEDKNQALFRLNTDLLGRYEQSYKAASLLRGGLLARLDQVCLENQVAATRDQLDTLHLDPAGGGSQ